MVEAESQKANTDVSKNDSSTKKVQSKKDDEFFLDENAFDVEK